MDHNTHTIQYLRHPATAFRGVLGDECVEQLAEVGDG